jgi:hypothetical protein
MKFSQVNKVEAKLVRSKISSESDTQVKWANVGQVLNIGQETVQQAFVQGE